MTLEVQPKFKCENCIKCGKRPHVEQHTKYWVLTCPNKNCKNLVKGRFVDFTTWNKQNKKAANFNTEQPLKKTA